jgi:hypothetical protein
MTLLKDKNIKTDELVCTEKLKTKNQAIEKRPVKMLSELGKTVSELKNGLYRLDKLPED